MRITLKRMGSIDNDTLEAVKTRIGQTFGCPVAVSPEVHNLDHAYDSARQQHLAPVLLESLEVSGMPRGERVLGLVDADLYAPGLRFVFGQADMRSGVAIVSLHRLRQEQYGLPPDSALLVERATKEAVHELGHTFGLRHCTNATCVMHFSNSLADTDRKGAAFCTQCRPKLIQ